MIPRTLSASSMQVWNLCPDRWVAEYMNRTPGFSNFAADTGTAVHGGLEDFVRALFLDKTHDVTQMSRKEQKELLITFYQMSYVKTFNSADMETPEYKDGFTLTMRWFERTDLTTKMMIGVESAELKETIPVPFNHPDGPTHTCEKCASVPNRAPGVCYIDFNYIMDRVDQISETEWEVIDYKTVRVPIQPEDLEVKVQARAYALAIQIKHPEATRIKVTFDLVRHEQVSIMFSRDDNIAFWRALTAETQRIVDTKEEDVRPVLNPECGYCVKKYSCPLMKKNIANGGIHSLSIDDTIALVDMVKNQMSAQKRLVDDLEEQIMMHAAKIEQLNFTDSSNTMEVQIGSRRQRTFPTKQAAEIMGPELFAQMGNMTIGNLEKVIKDPSIDKEIRDQLANLMEWTQGNLYVKIKHKSGMGL